MGVAREQHTASRLPDGRVIVAGGWDGASYLSSAEIYDPTSQSWASTGGMTSPRALHTATVMPAGTVMVAGGFNSQVLYLASAEVFDPARGTWASAGRMLRARFMHTATGLSDGRVLVAGGASPVGDVASAEIANH
jgi:hypothetical protein